MKRWGIWVGRRPRAVLALALAVVAAAAVFGMGVFGALKGGGFDDPGSQSYRTATVIDQKFAATRADVVVLYRSSSATVTDPAFRSSVERTLAQLDRADVAGVTSYYSTGAPALMSSDGHATRVILRLAGTDHDQRTASYDAIKDHLAAPGLRTDIGGQYAIASDVNSQVGGDIGRAESLSMPIVFLLSLLIFGSVAAALMPTLIGGVAVFGAFAVVRAITGVTDVSVFAINVITLLGMGLAIDYALFIVSRFREELPGGQASRAEVQAAMGRTMQTAGRAVFFSGTLVAASLASLLLFPQMFLRSMGFGGIAAVLVAMTAALTVLPAVLVLLGSRIEWGSLPWRRRSGGRGGRDLRAARGGRRGAHAPKAPISLTQRSTGVWARVAHGVMRRPVTVLVAVVALLLLLGSPFLGAKWGSVDERVLPASSPSRVAAEAITSTFPGQGPHADVVLRDTDQAELTSYVGRAKAVPGVQSVSQVAVSGRDTLLRVTWNGEGQSAASQQIVRDLRRIDSPGAPQALVGGPTAQAVDLVDSVKAHLPGMGVFVGVVMFILLFLAFGSILLPAKAIVMNTFSLAASFGVVTWVFQDGHLSGLLGFTPSGYLDSTQPILMLAILFGLSMDYEVFLLSRVREEWDRTGDNTVAVASGVQSTGRIITSAALLLAVVIGGFATSGIVFIKMIGVGMLVAVLIDATIVRMLLVPATMRLLGTLNWWAPRPMRRWWERHGHRERVVEDPVTTTV